MNYNFKIGDGFADIKFDYTHNQIINTLGKPNKIYNEDVLFALEYDKLGLYFSYNKHNNKLSELDIFTEKISYLNKNWYSLKKRNLLNEIKNIYKNKKLKYKFSYDKYEELKDEQYNFHEIGVTLFFENNKLYNVCLAKPIID